MSKTPPPLDMAARLRGITNPHSRIRRAMDMRGEVTTTARLWRMARDAGIDHPTPHDLRRIRIGKTLADRNKARA